MRYTVGYCLYPHGKDDSVETRMRLIFDDGLPATELNRHLVMAQLNRSKPLGTTVYQLCIYLNYLDMRGLKAVDATMDIIYGFLCELYVDGLPYAGDGTPKSYNTICDYVETLSIFLFHIKDLTWSAYQNSIHSLLSFVRNIRLSMLPGILPKSLHTTFDI